MDKVSGHKSAVQYLYPPVEPFDRRMMDVGDGHSIYVEQSGKPDGLPVIVLHGGPGGGSSPAMRRYFDPAIYRIILFDQRGCGRSTPHASVEANTTWHLVADIERIRETFGIAHWIVFGGSWGATLALIHAQTHPERVLHLVLRGVFTMTEAELTWFYGGGAGAFWPETWSRFCAPIPQQERGDMIAAYHKRLFSGQLDEEISFAKSWSAWENALATVHSTGVGGDSPADYARAFARLENHYFTHRGFLDHDGQILARMGEIAHIPGTIVQGRFDMICPPATAHRIAEVWPKCDLRMIPVAGHALSEPGISADLVSVMKKLATRF
ncbi:MAG: prolyl aminopeptidase [Rhodobacteraceae bacterium CG17_big_fil_post_rev_8_21_14_2_50_63_15]|nr:prolyl aminopeptidase [Roseovarius sp.]PIV78344.1 MAG: prolyl aminopeptidase [Rhodobacteraceae bacterium CG17_big_fil_post_rev_8_21_14_2_50_63_15]